MGSLFHGEIVQCPIFFITRNKGGQSQVTAVLRKTISQKKFRPSPAMVLFLRVYSPEVMAEYPVTNRKEPIRPLKIRPSAIKPVDIVLRRSE